MKKIDLHYKRWELKILSETFQDAPAMTQLLKLSSVMKKSAEAYHDGI